jgi:DNA-binding transcriptional MerR regulator
MTTATLRLKAMREHTGLSAATIRLYADAKLIPCEIDSNGHRIFPARAARLARSVHAQRMARTGRQAKG